MRKVISMLMAIAAMLISIFVIHATHNNPDTTTGIFIFTFILIVILDALLLLLIYLINIGEEKIKDE